MQLSTFSSKLHKRVKLLDDYICSRKRKCEESVNLNLKIALHNIEHSGRNRAYIRIEVRMSCDFDRKFVIL